MISSDRRNPKLEKISNRIESVVLAPARIYERTVTAVPGVALNLILATFKYRRTRAVLNAASVIAILAGASFGLLAS